MDRATMWNEGGVVAMAASAEDLEGGEVGGVVPALSEVYRQHHRFVWRSLDRLGVSHDRLADAVHDVFLVVARRLGEFEQRASIRTWLFAIAIRITQSVRRDEARKHRHLAALGHRTRAQNADRDEPHVRADAARTLRRLLDELDDDKRAVFIMAELEQMTAKEIAAVMGTKVATVYSRLRVARQRLERAASRLRAREQGGSR